MKKTQNIARDSFTQSFLSHAKYRKGRKLISMRWKKWRKLENLKYNSFKKQGPVLVSFKCRGDENDFKKYVRILKLIFQLYNQVLTLLAR